MMESLNKEATPRDRSKVSDRQVFSLRYPEGTGESAAMPEIDVLLDGLWWLAEQIGKDLQGAKPFANDEEFLQRVVPRMEWLEKDITVDYLKNLPDDLGRAKRAVYWPADFANQKGPIRCVSIWLCSLKTEKLCSVNLPVDWLFESEFEALAVRAREIDGDGAPAEVPEVFLEGYGPKAPSDASSLMLLIEAASSSDYDISHVTAELAVTARQTLLEPEERRWKEYDPKLIGVRQRGDLRVLIASNPLADVVEMLRQRRDVDSLGVGLLLGKVFQDPDGERFVDIEEIVPIGNLGSSVSKLQQQSGAWQQLFQRAKREFPGKRRLGWYRTVSDQELREEAVGLVDRLAGMVYRMVLPPSDSLRAADRDLQSSLFPESWQVTLLLDVKGASHTFFQKKKDTYKPCRGYYLYSGNS